MVLWLWNEEGAHRIEDPRFVPTFFLHAPPNELSAIRRRIEILDGVREVREATHRIALEDDEPKPVLEIVPRHYRDVQRVALILDSNGGYVDHRLFNVDVRFSQRYAMEHGIFPMGLVRYASGTWTAEEEHFALDYLVPPLRMTELDLRVDTPLGIPRMQDRLLGARIDDVELDGSEEDILRGIREVVRSKDPDVLLTLDGDAFAMPYLARKAAECGVDLQLGRDRDRFTEKKGKSYFTYGKIVYKPGQYLLRGRLHLDRGHFAYRESKLAGLAELSRLSTLTPQEQARLTPGTAFTAMQVNLACQNGCLVIWKKNRPEEFKNGEDLLRGDRGGFIFEPEVGLHEGLYELDFFALYPSIMVKYNISAETLDCPCCVVDGIAVPELKYHMCTRRAGLVPKVLKPILERRRYYKKMKKEPGPLQEVYRERDTILKWVLVTAFGYQGYRNARYGRIECHEAINAYARDILVRTMEIAESHGHEVVHGIVDSVWLRPKVDADPIEKVREHIAGSIGLPIELEGRYKWIVFLPCKTTGVGALNRYYGLYEHEEFKLRGIELRKHDTPEFINICQEAMLGELSYASNAAEFMERIPRAVNILRWTAKRVLDRAIPVHQFLLTKSVSRALPEYIVLTATAAALKQMEARGFSVEPGDSIRYILLDMRARESERKVRVAEFLQGDEEVDAWEYIRLLCRSGQTLLAPFGYAEEKLVAMCRDLSDVTTPAKAKEIEAHESVMGASHSQARGGVGYAHRWNIQDVDGESAEIPDDA
ncbi:MAG TPA: DNA polymerase domain-containing protein [Thermoplasmata archaeon]|jgi:DNA polymerase elongation subunit (family B)